MKNIFENAKFGDKFRTRDGRMAIFIQRYKRGIELRNELCIEDKEEGRRFYLYKDDGSFYHIKCGEDIISRWEEPINEEELGKLAKQEMIHLVSYNGLNLLSQRNKDHADLHNVYDLMKEMYKAGYRKAKEQI